MAAATAPSPVFAKGNLALITGGASGIGLALARRCIDYGMKVLVLDNNGSNLAAAKSSLGGSSVETIEMDVSQIADWSKVREVVEKGYNGKIDLLALNAGIGLQGSWPDSDYFHKIMDVNLFGVIHGLSTFVPLIQASPAPAHIIITGSKQGITNPPGNAAYNASKAAVKTLAEHLSYDLAKSTPTASVHLLVPGWTFTGLSGNEPFADAAAKKQKPAGAWSGEQVVEYLEQKIGERKFYIICPDNDVSEELDKKRMAWTAGDLIEGRPPLTRWRDEWREEANEWMAKQKY